MPLTPKSLFLNFCGLSDDNLPRLPPYSEKRKCRKFFSLFAFNPVFLESPASLKISQAEKAINLEAHLKIKYLSTKDAGITVREVIPKEVRQDAKNRYLIGFCCLKKEERTFKIDNIMELEIV